MYTNFKDLHKAYGFNNPNKTRADFNANEARAFVNDCFDTYEHIGFAKTFHAVAGFSDHSYDGLAFTVLERIKDFDAFPEDGEVELDALPMWKIRLEDGRTVNAFPEEICLAELTEDGYQHFADVAGGTEKDVKNEVHERKDAQPFIAGNRSGESKTFRYIKPILPKNDAKFAEYDFFTGRKLAEQERAALHQNK